MDDNTEHPRMSSRRVLILELASLIVAAVLVGLLFGFLVQNVVMGVIAAALVGAIAGVWLWRARRSSAHDEQTRSDTRQALDERRAHPEYGPLRAPGTFGVRVGSGAAGRDNGRT